MRRLVTTVRERGAELWFEPRRTISRAFERGVLDPLSFRTGRVRLRQRDLRGFSHLVASREGLFAVNRTGWDKVAPGQYFGLTFHEGAFYAFECLGRRRPPEEQDQPGYDRGRIVRLDLDGDRITGAETVHRGLPNDVHQIEFVDGRLHVVDTYNNRILRLSADLGSVEAEFHPVGPARQEDWEGGYAHLNSIVGHDGDVYVLKHNGRPEKAVRPSEIIRCTPELDILETIELNGNACHDIVFLEDGSFLSCGSHRGEIIDGERVVAQISDMFTRGLSVDANSVVVGSSFYTVRTGPHGRRYVPGQVMFFDREFELEATVILPAAPTDIRRIDGTDRR